MGLYDTFKLTNSRPMSTYVPMPIDEFKDATEKLLAKYNQGMAQDLLNMKYLSSAQSAPFEGDRNLLNAIKDKHSKELQSRVSAGDYEALGQQAMMSGMQFQQEYAPIAGNLEAFNAWKKELDERLSKGSIIKDQYDRALDYSTRNYKGLDPENLAGSRFAGYKPVDYVDLFEIGDKFIKDWKANTSESPFQYSGGMFWKKTKKTEAKYEDIYEALQERLMNDPKARNFIEEQVMFETSGKTITDEMVQPYRDYYRQKPETKAIADSLTNDQIMKKAMMDTIVDDYARPLAEKASFVDITTTEKLDPGAAERARFTARAEEERRLVELHTSYSTFDENPAYKEQKELLEDRNLQYDSKGNLVNPNGTSMAIGDKQKLWRAKTEMERYRVSYLNNLSAELARYSALPKSPDYARLSKEITRVRNLNHRELSKLIMDNAYNRQAAIAVDIKPTEDLSNSLRKEIIVNRDFQGRALFVNGKPGITTMNQLLDELSLTDGDSKTAEKVSKFYNSMRITGINLTGGISDDAAAGAYRVTAIDPNTGNNINFLLENNGTIADKVPTKDIFKSISQANTFSMTSSKIGFPVTANEHNRLSPEELESKYEGHVIKDFYNEPNHRMVVYNTINSNGKEGTMVARQSYNPATGKWVTAALPNQVRNLGKIPSYKVGLMTLSDLMNETKAIYTNYEANPRISKEKRLKQSDETIIYSGEE